MLRPNVALTTDPRAREHISVRETTSDILRPPEKPFATPAPEQQCNLAAARPAAVMTVRTCPGAVQKNSIRTGFGMIVADETAIGRSPVHRVWSPPRGGITTGTAAILYLLLCLLVQYLAGAWNA